MAEIKIRDVWRHNLETEFETIKQIIEKYPYVAMDTEFPGIVLKPVGEFTSNSDYKYKALKENVDMLYLIQLGLTFSDELGNLPSVAGHPSVWQFNFREFDSDRHAHAAESISLLRNSGIDFRRNNSHGVDASRFGELLMSSGVVLNDDIRWVTFHSAYDFGYLLKVLTQRELPATHGKFFDLIGIFFPTVYDIENLMKYCTSLNLYGGLSNVARLLGVERVGICHQAGSDSLLTSSIFHELRKNHFTGSLENYAGVSLPYHID